MSLFATICLRALFLCLPVLLLSPAAAQEAPQPSSQDIITDLSATSDSFNGLAYGDVEWGDYDNDRDLDLVLTGIDQNNEAQTYLYRNDNGSFQLVNTNIPGVSRGAMDWGDYDRDGDLDLLILGDTSGNTFPSDPNTVISRVYRNTNGSFEDAQLGLIGLAWGGAEWGDFEGDGDLDILVSGSINFFTEHTRVYINNQGDFSEFLEVGGDNAWGIQGSATWADYDGDRYLEILTSSLDTETGKSPNTILYDYNFQGGFNSDSDTFINAFQGASAWGDIDSDGDLDVVVSGTEETFFFEKETRIYQQVSGTPRFITFSEPSPIGTSNGQVAWADYDNDGDLDLSLTGTSEGKPRIYPNFGNNDFYVDTIILPDTWRNSAFAWGDYDSDSDLDLILTGEDGSGTRRTVLYQNSNTQTNNPPSIPTNVQTAEEEGALLLFWNAPSDDRTPSAGLTYNLRLGTTPGGSEISSAQAHSDGKPKVVRRGNIPRSAGWSISNLPSGTYYWSVQAIDNSFAGSAFTAEQSYTLGGPVVPDLIIENLNVTPGSAMPGDQVTVSYTIKNNGRATASAFKTNVRIATSSEEVTVNDDLLDSFDTSALAQGASVNKSTNLSLPDDLSGGEYYIWVITDVNSSAGQSDESNDKDRAPLTIEAPLPESFGTTVIVHGYNGGPLNFGDDGLEFDQHWTLTMAEAFVQRMGKGQIYTLVDGVLRKDENRSIGEGGESVVVFDWLEESRWATRGFAEGAGDALAALLVQGALDESINLDLSQLHFIGHSRGTVVSSEAIQRFEYWSSPDLNALPDGLVIDRSIHFTTLDPHPWEDVLGDGIGEPGSADDYDVNSGLTLFGQNAIVCWDNVDFADNYWQTARSLSGLSSLTGCSFRNTYDLSELTDMSHGAITAWYHGTALSALDQPISNGNDEVILPEWYIKNGEDNRLEEGFNLSKSLNGDIESIQTRIEATYKALSDQNFNEKLLFNGDFEQSDKSLIGRLPGWQMQGGGGSTSLSLDLPFSYNQYLRLNTQSPSVTHNWFYIPKDESDFLHFRYRVNKEDPSEFLVVRVDGRTLESVPLNQTSIFLTKSVNIAEFAGSTQRVELAIERQGAGSINSTIHIDDVGYEGPAYLAIALAPPVSSTGKRSDKHSAATVAATLQVTDQEGNLTGALTDSTSATEIPGSSFRIVEDSLGNSIQVIRLPQLATGEYTFEVSQIEADSPVNLYIQDVQEKTVSARFENIMLPASGSASTTLSNVNPAVTLSLDLNNDGLEDSTRTTDYLEEFAIGATAGPNGTILPGNIVGIYGDTLTFEIVPDEGFEIATLVVDSVSVTPANSYTFEFLDANHSIEATFQVLEPTNTEENISSAFNLAQNYPNPFQDKTTIQFSIPGPQYVVVNMYDLLGRKIATLVDGHLTQGTHTIHIDGADYPSGTYIYALKAEGKTLVKTLSLLR